LSKSKKISANDLIPIGKIVRPHGVSGRLKAISYSGRGDAFAGAGTVYIRGASGAVQGYKLLEFSPHKNSFLLLLEGITSLERSEEIRDAEILIRKDELVREPDEFFWFELIGLGVYLEDGAKLGSITEIIPTGSNDIYVVRHENGEKILVPAIHDVVCEVDLEGGRMVIAPLEGMIEPDAV